MSDREQLGTELQQMIQHIRNHVPDAVINTRLANADESGMVIHAQIMGSSGAAGAAHASAAFGDASAEQAENRAIERAMIAMGIPALPVETTAPKLHRVTTPEPAGRMVRFPAQDAEREDTVSSDPEPEDISWTAFWTWARVNGFASRDALETAIGQPINQLTPGQVRKLAQDVIDAR